MRQIAVPVEQLIVPADGEDEPRWLNETVTDYVRRTAHDKNQRAQTHLQSAHGVSQVPTLLPILSADTTVAIGQTILGKPTDVSDARRILSTLAGQTHDVYTAVVLSIGERQSSVLTHTRVSVDASIADSLDDYIASGEPFGKAGAYGIQGLAAAYITGIEGSYTSVVGLPLYETAQLLREAGLYQ